jgi:hypothetical protein
MVEPRKTVIALFLSSIEALLARDLNLLWRIDTFAHEIIFLAQATGLPFDYAFDWVDGGPHAPDLVQDLLLISTWTDGAEFILRDDAMLWILPTYRLIRPPEGIDPFRFDEWIATVCLAERLREERVRAGEPPCTALVSALLAVAPECAAFAPEATARVCAESASPPA